MRTPAKPFSRFIATGISLAIGMLAHSAALAQAALPNAGDVQRQNAAPGPMLPKAEPALPKAPELRPQLQTADGFSVVVNGFRITGNTAIKETDLQLLVVDGLGKKSSFAELQATADMLSRYYRERGYFVARAYLPQQEIAGGIVEIAVLEGTVGTASVKQEGAVRTQAAVAQRYLDANAPAGSIVQEKALERAALLANDLPGISAGISLDPGSSTGLTDVTLTTAEGRLFSATVDLDNYGNRFTGDIRLGTTLNLNSPLGLGDQASLRIMHSNRDLALLRANYQVPVGSGGGRIGVAASRVLFEVCCQLGISPSGASTMLTLYGLYPLERQRQRSTYFNASFDNKKQINYSGIGAGREREIDVLTLGGSFESRDEFAGGGLSYGNISLAMGHLSIKDPADATTDAAGTKAAGGFTKVSLQSSRTQRLNDRFSLYGGITGQLASKNLDSAEKFGLGGAQGVRGYPSGEGSGDEGYIAQIELRADLPVDLANTQWQGFLFYDYGGIRVNKNKYIVGGLTPNGYHLASWGLGLNVAKAGTFQLRTMWASKLGSNPGRNIANNTDADGKSDRSRFWLQAVTQF